MGIVDVNGIYMYDDTDGAPTPPTLNLGQQSVSDALKRLRTIQGVANIAGRTALLAQLAAAGASPSATKPLVVNRADAPLYQRLESTIDGVTWVTHPGAPPVVPYAYGDIRRSDSQPIVNNGNTDLKVIGGANVGVGWNTSWNGRGLYNPLPGRWWVQATIATNISGPRYLELGVAALAPDSLGTLGPTAVDTAPNGFGRATMEGLVIATGAFGIMLSVYNNGNWGDIRSGSLRAVWLGP